MFVHLISMGFNSIINKNRIKCLEQDDIILLNHNHLVTSSQYFILMGHNWF